MNVIRSDSAALFLLTVGLACTGPVTETAIETVAAPQTLPALRCSGCHAGARVFAVLPDSLRRGFAPVSASFSHGRADLAVAAPPAMLAARACLPCHAGQHAEWTTTGHARAWTKASFRAAFALEPERWCANCHAPLAEQNPFTIRDGRAEYDPSRETALTREGVNCAVCHVRDGAVYGTKKNEDCAFPVREDPLFATAGACAGCHDFAFPATLHPEIRDSPEPMQTTAAEFAASVQHARGESCQSCHFAKNEKQTHDTNRTGSVRIDFDDNAASETGARVVAARIRIPVIGHRWPTGDLFRSVEFLVRDRNGRTIGFYKIAMVYDHGARELVNDTTLRPDTTGGVDRTIEIPVRGEPYRCLATYFLQKGAESRLKSVFDEATLDREFRRALYNGPCDSP